MDATLGLIVPASSSQGAHHLHRRPLSALSERAARQTRDKVPWHTALPVPEYGVCPRSMPLDDDNRGCVPEVQQHIIAMRLNARGVRDTAQVLHINTDTGLSARTQRERAGAVEMKARGSFSGRSKPSGGCGVRSITPQVQSWPMCLGVGRMRAFCSAQRCWSPADSPGVL